MFASRSDDVGDCSACLLSNSSRSTESCHAISHVQCSLVCNLTASGGVAEKEAAL